MLRSMLLLLLVLAAAPAVHAQGTTDRTSAPIATDSEHTQILARAFRGGYDPRLVIPGRAGSPLAEPASSELVLVHQLPTRSYWKAGAITGGILGGALGFAHGSGLGNVITGGEMRVGKYAIRQTLLGAAAGALLGGGIGSLVRK